MIGLGFVKEFFRNYEVVKLHIVHPPFLNSLIYLSLLLATLATLKRKSSTLLDFSQTEQLKGLAILVVIIGHFWLHICNEKGPFYYFADYAVTLFLLLSGYGLMCSNMAHRVTTREFLAKRLRKIFIPYWLVTLVILVADYILLNKTYPAQNLLLTSIGINFFKTLQYIDYVRWFITFLLIYYLIFFFCARIWKPPYAAAAILLFSLVLFCLRHYEIFPLGARHQLLAFPLGCLAAVIGPVQWWDKINIRFRTIFAVFVTLAMLSIYFGDLQHTDNTFMKRALIYLNSYIQPYLFCLLCIISISFLAATGYISRFLTLCGSLSFELYLIHGSLLIKYNPILGNLGNRHVLVGLFLWLGMVMGIAYILKTSASPIVHAVPITNRLK